MPKVPSDNTALLGRSVARARGLEAHDPQIRQLRSSPGVLAEVLRCRHAVEVFALVCERYADRPALGERAREVWRDPATGRAEVRYGAGFHTTSYAELWQRAVALASGWHAANIAHAGTFVGICGFGSADFVVAEMACLYLGAVSVPLQTTLPPNDLARIVREAELGCLVASRAQLEQVASLLPDCPSVQSLGVIDWHAQDAADVELLERVRGLLSRRGCRLWTLPELDALGRQGEPVAMHVPAEGTDPLVTLVYTSGSTGVPKGAMFTDRLWLQTWNRKAWGGGRLPLLPQLTVNYLPLNHMMGRGLVIGTLVQGGLVQFTLASDLSTLFEDIRLVRPTALTLVPRVAELIYQHFQRELLQRGGAEADADPALEEQLLGELRAAFLGDRLLVLRIGSAPTSPEVLRFLKRCFQVPVFEGYGSTEAGIITVDDRIADEAILDYKLIDAPGAGYCVSDRPHPRGELLVKARWSVPGYYKSPAATRELYDDDGWLHTGDVVEELGPGHLSWVDRARDVLKLAHGEFVALHRLESLLAGGGPLIHQVYLYGSADRAYMVGVVVPARAAVQARLARELHPGDEDEVKRLLRAELERMAARQGLRPFELPRDFLVEWEPFTQQNGLLTESNKPARRRLKQRYQDRLERLYADLARAQLRGAIALQRDATASVEQKLRAAVQALLGLQDLDMQQRFTDLGGDSVAAVQLAGLIQETFGVRIPEGQLLDPASSLAGLVQAIEQALRQRAANRPTFATIHGAGATTLRATELRLDRFLPASELAAAAGLKYSPASPEQRACLLTGASGFLGRFLTVELLERLPAGGRLYCLVRAADDAAATRRLRAVFAAGDPGLHERFERLAAGRLVVLAGDLMQPGLGLCAAMFEHLAGELDLIVHNGALVNHAFSYVQLFEPNVLGTVELIRLALHRRLKALSYVSTVGVTAGAHPAGRLAEGRPASELWPVRPVDAGYAVGYATSKWASEILLGDMHARTGAPVAIFRPTMILTPERYEGEINTPDLFVRLLAGLVYTGVAPGSFYASAGGQQPSFDGMPVDFSARAIAAIALALPPISGTFHVANPQGNADVSLDTVVDWVISAGYPLERIADHTRWFQEFGRRLRALDEPHRRHSPLPILSSWEAPGRVEPQGGLDNTLFRARVREFLGDVPLPSLNEALVHKTLAAMVSRGLISPPARPSSVTWAPSERASRPAEGP